MIRILIATFFIGSLGHAADAENPVSFQQAYQKILSLSLRNDIQKYNVDIARAKHLKPVGQFTPQVAIVGSDIQGGPPGYQQRPVTLGASINLFRFGADALEFRSTNLYTKSQEEKLFAEKLSTEEDALLALFTVIRLSTSLDVYQGISNNRAELLRIADERYRKGLLALQEVEKVRVDFENSKARQADTFNDLQDAEAVVASQLGFTWTSKTWPWTEIIKTRTQDSNSSFKLNQIPQYRSAVLIEDSGRVYERALTRRLLPSLDLSFTYGNIGYSNAPNYYAGTLALTIPLFDQLSQYSNYKQAEGIANQAVAQKNFLIRELPPQFETAQKKFVNSLDSTLRREKNLSVSRKLYDDNFSRFKQGRVSVNDLLIDQNRLSDAELLAIEAWYNLHLHYERLCHANGQSVSVDATCVVQNP